MSWLTNEQLDELQNNFPMGDFWPSLPSTEKVNLSKLVAGRWGALPWLPKRRPTLVENDAAFRNLDDPLTSAYAMHLKEFADRNNSPSLEQSADDFNALGIMADIPTFTRNILLGSYLYAEGDDSSQADQAPLGGFSLSFDGAVAEVSSPTSGGGSGGGDANLDQIELWAQVGNNDIIPRNKTSFNELETNITILEGNINTVKANLDTEEGARRQADALLESGEARSIERINAIHDATIDLSAVDITLPVIYDIVTTPRLLISTTRDFAVLEALSVKAVLRPSDIPRTPIYVIVKLPTTHDAREYRLDVNATLVDEGPAINYPGSTWVMVAQGGGFNYFSSLTGNTRVELGEDVASVVLERSQNADHLGKTQFQGLPTQVSEWALKDSDDAIPGGLIEAESIKGTALDDASVSLVKLDARGDRTGGTLLSISSSGDALEFIDSPLATTESVSPFNEIGRATIQITGGNTNTFINTGITGWTDDIIIKLSFGGGRVETVDISVADLTGFDGIDASIPANLTGARVKPNRIELEVGDDLRIYIARSTNHELLYAASNRSSDAQPLIVYGYRNIVGPRGAAGTNGSIGPDGIRGPQGTASTVAGPKGDKGDRGERGRGPAGNDGTDGVDGIKGDKGDKGDRGSAGVSNTPGPRGPTGPAPDITDNPIQLLGTYTFTGDLTTRSDRDTGITGFTSTDIFKIKVNGIFENDIAVSNLRSASRGGGRGLIAFSQGNTNYLLGIPDSGTNNGKLVMSQTRGSTAVYNIEIWTYGGLRGVDGARGPIGPSGGERGPAGPPGADGMDGTGGGGGTTVTATTPDSFSLRAFGTTAYTTAWLRIRTGVIIPATALWLRIEATNGNRGGPTIDYRVSGIGRSDAPGTTVDRTTIGIANSREIQQAWSLHNLDARIFIGLVPALNPVTAGDLELVAAAASQSGGFENIRVRTWYY